MKYLSPAKINLFLHITGKRDDGYHNLETIFQIIDIYDEITIELLDNTTITRISGNEDIPEAEDLMIRAAKLLQHTTGVDLGVRISIKKKIPCGGGLGGGSSNAATVLLALNDLWNTKLSNTQLQHLGLQLGADVPIFVLQKNAFARGVGEILTPVDLPQHYYLILCPNEHISTAKIFSHSALTNSPEQGKIPSFLQALYLGNDCLDAVVKSSSGVAQALEYLNTTKNSIGNAKLSGTGSCVFAVFSCEKDCKIALQEYQMIQKNCKKDTYTHAFIAKGIGREI